MNIIVNQNKELRVTGYDAEKGCNLLDIDFYLSKGLESTKPVHCVIDNRYHFILLKEREDKNYDIYKIFDFFNVSLDKAERKINLIIEEENTEILNLNVNSLIRNSVKAIKVGRESAK
jgi:hypothetical protein